jgi:hypothetical protein
MLARTFVWIGGVLFVAALAVCAYSYLIVWGRPVATTTASAIPIDALLLTLFAAHHSLFARDPVKAWLVRAVPRPLLRSVYVWTASVLLILVCVLWRPIGSEIYRAAGGLAVVLALVQLVGVWLIAQAIKVIDPLELAGIRPASATSELQIAGPYRVVRHPLYLGWMLAVFGAPHLTGSRLLFAALTSFYLVIAIPWEERSLVTAFGDRYVRYTRSVPWRVVPFVY